MKSNWHPLPDVPRCVADDPHVPGTVPPLRKVAVPSLDRLPALDGTAFHLQVFRGLDMWDFSGTQTLCSLPRPRYQFEEEFVFSGGIFGSFCACDFGHFCPSEIN